jgi:hypothetical protein
VLAVVPERQNPRTNRKMADKGCSAEGCTKSAIARDLCRPHYMGWWRDQANKPGLRPYDGDWSRFCDSGHEFTPENTRLNKNGSRRCVVCYRARRMASLRSGREREQYGALRQFLNALKDAPCMDCGVQYPPHVMDFDHRDPTTKKGLVSQMRCHEKIVEEVAKCDLVCSNCHRERTQQRHNLRKAATDFAIKAELIAWQETPRTRARAGLRWGTWNGSCG